MFTEHQLDLFGDVDGAVATNDGNQEILSPNIFEYDRYVVFFSGGKDSLACVLHLLDQGVDRDRIELHHHLIDGNEGSDLMDWPVTDGYCQAVATHLGVTYRKSWREGGFEREMNRTEQATAPVWIPSPDDDGYVRCVGDGPLGTRLKFPQVSANLAVRWCSSALKIDVGARYLANHPVFREGKTLVITGERAEESTARAKYKTFEPHRSDLRKGLRYQRHIDHWRPIHQWPEALVWEIIERHSVMPHPSYYLGWGRTSCRQCIFGSANQWATVAKIAPDNFVRIANYEHTFKVTIHRSETVLERAAKGKAYDTDPFWIEVANSKAMGPNVYMEDWKLPSGAYGESCGPT